VVDVRAIRRETFSRDKLFDGVWTFVEVSPFAGASGDVAVATRHNGRAIALLPATTDATVVQADAVGVGEPGALISTDPPYYDNIGYSDLSDFFTSAASVAA